MGAEVKEQFRLLFLDRKNRLVRDEVQQYFSTQEDLNRQMLSLLVLGHSLAMQILPIGETAYACLLALVLSVNAPDAGAAEEELAVAYADERLEGADRDPAFLLRDRLPGDLVNVCDCCPRRSGHRRQC